MESETVNACQKWISQEQAEEAAVPQGKGFCRGSAPPAPLGEGDPAPRGMFSFRDRRAKKRDFRKLFIIRLTAAAEMRGMRYSRLIHGLRLAKIGLDRKSLSELAIHDPETFDAIVAKVRTEIDKHDAEVRPARRPRRPERGHAEDPGHQSTSVPKGSGIGAALR